MKSAQTIIKGAPIQRKGVRAQHPVMRPDESIEDVLKRITLERIALDAPRYGRGTASVEAKETQAELGGKERSQFFRCEFRGSRS